MNIVLFGYGKMGKMIEEMALQKGHLITAKITSSTNLTIINDSLKKSDLCIDFSQPEAALENIKISAKFGKSIVMGTTAWYEHLPEVKQIVKESNIGFMYAPNFSLGVHLFLKIVSEAASLMNSFNHYDVGIVEAHHNKKMDSPSGTAKSIANALLTKIQRKNCLEFNSFNQAPSPETLQVTSLRCGSIPGTHSVIFDSTADSITLTHEARNREGFAIGALSAAEWLYDKKGFFTIDDMLGG